MMKAIGINYPMLWLGGGIFYGMLAILIIAFAVSSVFQKLSLQHVDHKFNKTKTIPPKTSSFMGTL